MDSNLRAFGSPQKPLSTMVLAFGGWPDASESATSALRYLIKITGARKFAEIDPEEFYDFTTVRPESRLDANGIRTVCWPSNEFYEYTPENDSTGTIFFLGTEPSFRWRTFSQLLLEIIQQCHVKFVITIGALLDSVPHTREPRVTGRSSSKELTQKAEWLGIQDSDYQGPTGIHSAFMEECIKIGVEYTSIWGHSPHYISRSPNPSVSCSILNRLRNLVDIEFDMKEQIEAGKAFEIDISNEIAKQVEVAAYVRKLEEAYDAKNTQTPSEIPSPSSMVKELEGFLKSQQDKNKKPEI